MLNHTVLFPKTVWLCALLCSSRFFLSSPATQPQVSFFGRKTSGSAHCSVSALGYSFSSFFSFQGCPPTHSPVMPALPSEIHRIATHHSNHLAVGPMAGGSPTRGHHRPSRRCVPRPAPAGPRARGCISAPPRLPCLPTARCAGTGSGRGGSHCVLAYPQRKMGGVRLLPHCNQH